MTEVQAEKLLSLLTKINENMDSLTTATIWIGIAVFFLLIFKNMGGD